MNADRVEVTRDEKSGDWLVRIRVGEEVIRRRFREGKGADEATLRSAAVKTAADEGYTIDPSSIIIT